jgi:site-specific DNA recombinase
MPDESDTVILIYKLYLEQDMGVRLIARHLNEQGITTRQGKRWSIVGIRDILRNRTYLGTYSRFGVKVPASHQSIIPDYVFKRVQEKLESKSTKVERAHRTQFLLTGMIYCGYCGNRMIGVNRSQTWTRSKDGGRSTGTYRYYQCQSRTNQGICQYHTRKASDLEETALATLRKYSNPQTREQSGAEPPPVLEPGKEEIQALVTRLKSLDRKFRMILDKAARNDISIEEFRAKGRELNQQRQFLSQRLALMEAEATGEITKEQRRQFILEEMDKLQQQWDSLTLPSRKDLLQYVIDRIVVYDDRVETSLRL